MVVDYYFVDPSPGSFLLIDLSRGEVDWNTVWAKQSDFDMCCLIVSLLIDMVESVFIL